MTTDLASDRARIRSAIGPWGAWSFGFAYAPAAAMREAAQAIEATGYGCLWYPETLDSHEAYTNAATLLAATERLHIATGIASIWSRDARASVQAARTLADASNDRFILGLGVSHRPLITARGHVYEKPVATMRGYLDAMDEADDAVPLGDGLDLGQALAPRTAPADAPSRRRALPWRPPVSRHGRPHAPRPRGDGTGGTAPR